MTELCVSMISSNLYLPIGLAQLWVFFCISNRHLIHQLRLCNAYLSLYLTHYCPIQPGVQFMILPLLFFQNFKELYLIQFFINCLALLNMGSYICKVGACQFLESKTTLLNFQLFRFFERLQWAQKLLQYLAVLHCMQCGA